MIGNTAMDASEPRDLTREQLAAMLGALMEGVTVQDATGRLVYVNDAAARLTGYETGGAMLAAWTNARLTGFTMLDESGERLPAERLPGRLVLSGQDAPETVVRFRSTVTGQERWSIVNSAPILDADGKVQFAVNIFRDITERKRAEEAIRFLATASRLLSESLDLETTLQQVANLAVPVLADWCVVDLVEQHKVRRVALAHVDPERVALARELQERYPDDPNATNGVPHVLRTGRPEVVEDISDVMIEAAARDADHLRLIRALQLRSYLIVPLVARGHTLGAITLVGAESGRQYGLSDVSLAEELAGRAAMALDNARLYREAQEQAEAHMLLNAALREVIGERDEALRRLEDTLRTREEFLASAAHDLKNPLAGIKANLQLMERRARGNQPPDPGRLADDLARLDRATSRAVAQVEELLDLARLQMGQALELNRARKDLVPLVRDVMAEYAQRSPQHEVRLEEELESVIGDWDGPRLARVVNNLLDNAIRYSPQGGTITVNLRSESTEGQQLVTLSVRDPGLGIPADDLSHVFERFHRGSNVRGQIAGTGLGLASARSIVEAHGGTISVDSRDGQGSVFTVRLPVHVSAAQAHS